MCNAAAVTYTIVNEDFDKSLTWKNVTVDKGVSVIDSGDSSHGSVLAFGATENSGAHGITIDVGATAGTVNLSMYARAGFDQWLSVYAYDSDGDNVKLLSFYYNGGASAMLRCTNDDGTAGTDWQSPIVKDTANVWFKVEMSMVIGGTSTTYIEPQNGSGWTRTQDPTLANYSVDDIDKIVITNQDTCDTSNANWVDDLKITHTENEQLPEGYLFLEKFDKMTTSDDIKSKFTLRNTGCDNASVADNSLALTGNEWQGVVLKHDPITSGQVTWSMKVTPNDNFFSFRAYDKDAAYDSSCYVEAASVGDATQLNIPGMTSVQGIEGQIYTLNVLIDLDRGKLTSQWLDVTGQILSENFQAFPYSGVAHLSFVGNWTTADNVTYFDDIVVREGNYLRDGRIFVYCSGRPSGVDGDAICVLHKDAECCT